MELKSMDKKDKFEIQFDNRKLALDLIVMSSVQEMLPYYRKPQLALKRSKIRSWDIPTPADCQKYLINKGRQVYDDILRALEAAEGICLCVSQCPFLDSMVYHGGVLCVTAYYLNSMNTAYAFLGSMCYDDDPTQEECLGRVEELLNMHKLTLRCSKVVDVIFYTVDSEGYVTTRKVDIQKKARSTAYEMFSEQIQQQMPNQSEGINTHFFDTAVVRIIDDMLIKQKEIPAETKKAVIQVFNILSYLLVHPSGSNILGEYAITLSNPYLYWMYRRLFSVLAETPDIMLNAIGCPTLSHWAKEELRDIILTLSLVEGCFSSSFEPPEKYFWCTSSHLLPSLIGLKKRMKEVQSKRVRLSNSFSTIFLGRIEGRICNLQQSYVYNMAAVLDPRYRLSWCDGDKTAAVLRKVLISEVCRLLENETDTELSHITNTQKTEDVIRQRQLVAEYEVDHYLIQNIRYSNSPLNFWKTTTYRRHFPHLYTLACRYLCVPSEWTTSDKIVHATAINQLVSKEQGLHKFDIECLLFLRCNIFNEMVIRKDLKFS